MNLETKIADMKAELAKLEANLEQQKNKLDVDISDCYPKDGDTFIHYINGFSDEYSNGSLYDKTQKDLDICFGDVAQRQRAIRWRNIDKLWKHFAAEDQKGNGLKVNSYIFGLRYDRSCPHIDVVAGNLSLPKTYEFHRVDNAQKALNQIG